MFYERRKRKVKIQKNLINVTTLFLCHDTLELGTKLKGKFVSQHNSLVSRHKFKRALKEMSQHIFLCRETIERLSLKLCHGNYFCLSRQSINDKTNPRAMFL